MNKCMFLGRLTADPVIRDYSAKEDGKKVEKTMAFFSLAVNRGGDEADFINVKCFGNLAEFAEDYLEKGKQIVLESHVSSGKYENDEGETVYFTEFIADRIHFTGKKEEDNKSKKK